MRLPELVNDGHSKCANCIGKLCSFDDHCVECADWPNERFDRYVKHRHMLELTRARKAKQRAKSKQSTLPVTSEQAIASAAHSVSPSPSASVVSLSPSSSISPYSPSATTKTILSSSHISVPSAPSDQVVTRSEFDCLKSMMTTIAADLAAMRKSGGSSMQVHSESAPPPSQLVPSNPVVQYQGYRDGDPAVSRSNPSLVEGSSAPMGESRPTGSCPVVQVETLDVGTDRSRKRVRDSFDSVDRSKRQRPPSRERSATPTRSAGGLRHSLSPPPRSARGTPTGLGGVSARVPQRTPSSKQADGTFSDSMVASLEALVAAQMQCNPSLTFPQAMIIAKDHVKRTDPLNESYVSSRSGQVALGHKDLALAGNYAPEKPTVVNLSPEEGGGLRAPGCYYC